MSSSIAELVTLLSLNLTLNLVNAGQVAGTLPITAATATTPITVTSTAHGVPMSRVVHGVVAGVTGETEANGLWVLTPLDANTFALSTLSPQGILANSVGVNAYVSGGTISYAFPDYQILLGRQMLALASAVASPRIAFVPTNGRRWTFEPYGGQGAAPFQQLGSLEQQSQKLQPQLATKWRTFEVHITGAANPPQPNFGDLDAVDALESALYAVMFDTITPTRFNWLAEKWPSQLDPKDPQATGSNTQRGQQTMHLVEIATPVTKAPLQFVPKGTSIVFTVEPINPLVPQDQTTIDIVGS
jgi:hypothetical protein